MSPSLKCIRLYIFIRTESKHTVNVQDLYSFLSIDALNIHQKDIQNIHKWPWYKFVVYNKRKDPTLVFQLLGNQLPR